MATMTETEEVERRVHSSDHKEYTFDEFVQYHSGNREAATADWNNSVPAGGALDLGLGDMNLEVDDMNLEDGNQQDQVQQHLQQIRAEHAAKAASQQAAAAAGPQQSFQGRPVTVRDGYVYYTDELNNNPHCDPIGTWVNNQVNTEGYAGAHEETALSAQHGEATGVNRPTRATRTTAQNQQKADAAAQDRLQTAAKKAEKEAQAAAAAQTRFTGTALATGGEVDKNLQELQQLKENIGAYLPTDFEEAVRKHLGPENKNRQQADMLAAFVRKTNQTGRSIGKEEKAQKAAALKQNEAQFSLKRSRDLLATTTTSAADNLQAAETAAQAAPIQTEEQRAAKRQALRDKIFGGEGDLKKYYKSFFPDPDTAAIMLKIQDCVLDFIEEERSQVSQAPGCFPCMLSVNDLP
eukprot:COSAG06_NODE_5832_length_3253_cov_4.584337_2_plen_408_part_00